MIGGYQIIDLDNMDFSKIGDKYKIKGLYNALNNTTKPIMMINNNLKIEDKKIVKDSTRIANEGKTIKNNHAVYEYGAEIISSFLVDMTGWTNMNEYGGEVLTSHDNFKVFPSRDDFEPYNYTTGKLTTRDNYTSLRLLMYESENVIFTNGNWQEIRCYDCIVCNLYNGTTKLTDGNTTMKQSYSNAYNVSNIVSIIFVDYILKDGEQIDDGFYGIDRYSKLILPKKYMNEFLISSVIPRYDNLDLLIEDALKGDDTVDNALNNKKEYIDIKDNTMAYAEKTSEGYCIVLNTNGNSALFSVNEDDIIEYIER